jgi:hypothetical protein
MGNFKSAMIGIWLAGCFCTSALGQCSTASFVPSELEYLLIRQAGQARSQDRIATACRLYKRLLEAVKQDRAMGFQRCENEALMLSSERVIGRITDTLQDMQCE